jgi:hypothetical protein
MDAIGVVPQMNEMEDEITTPQPAKAERVSLSREKDTKILKFCEDRFTLK